MEQTPARLPEMDARAIIEKAKDVLIVRSREEDPYPGLWTFPGGAVEAEDSPEVALRKHMRRRLGIRVELIVGQPPFIHDVQGIAVTFRYYICGILEGEPATEYWPEVRWVHKARLSEYDFEPQAKQVAEWLGDANK
jgi:8-oxo-dGTP diphosphatase